MTKNRKLYDKLEVPPDASPSVIKKAYRKKAKVNHPDAGGSSEEFAAINRAYLILVDPVLRYKYDKTGDESLSQPDNAAAQALQIIAGAMEVVIAKLENKGRDPATCDLVSMMRTEIKEQVAKYESNINACNILIKKTNKLLGKFKVKKGNNFLEQMLNAKIENIGLNIRNSEREMGPLKAACDLLNDVTFSFDRPAGPSEVDMKALSDFMFKGFGAV